MASNDYIYAMDPGKNKIHWLVEKAQSGDESSFSELFELYHRSVHRFLAYRVGSPEDAEDLTQTVFLEMVRSLPRFRVRNNVSFSSWVFRIARNRLIDYYRQRKSTLDIDSLNPGEHPSLQSEAGEPELDTRIRLIRQHMRRLPETYQTILQLTLVEDLDLREVASIMDISVLHARVLKHRALKKIRAMMPDNSYIYAST